MTNTYARAYTEVLEILSHFSKEEYSRIPTEKIEFYKSNMDNEYHYKINPEIDLYQQYISKEANAILITLFRDYFATEKQKIVLENLLKDNQIKLEKEKNNKYNSDNIFKEKISTKNIAQEENFSMVEYKQSFISKVLNKIKRIFNK